MDAALQKALQNRKGSKPLAEIPRPTERADRGLFAALDDRSPVGTPIAGGGLLLDGGGQLGDPKIPPGDPMLQLI